MFVPSELWFPLPTPQESKISGTSGWWDTLERPTLL